MVPTDNDLEKECVYHETPPNPKQAKKIRRDDVDEGDEEIIESFQSLIKDTVSTVTNGLNYFGEDMWSAVESVANLTYNIAESVAESNSDDILGTVTQGMSSFGNQAANLLLPEIDDDEDEINNSFFNQESGEIEIEQPNYQCFDSLTIRQTGESSCNISNFTRFNSETKKEIDRNSMNNNDNNDNDNATNNQNYNRNYNHNRNDNNNKLKFQHINQKSELNIIKRKEDGQPEDRKDTLASSSGSTSNHDGPCGRSQITRKLTSYNKTIDTPNVVDDNEKDKDNNINNNSIRDNIINNSNDSRKDNINNSSNRSSISRNSGSDDNDSSNLNNPDSFSSNQTKKKCLSKTPLVMDSMNKSHKPIDNNSQDQTSGDTSSKTNLYIGVVKSELLRKVALGESNDEESHACRESREQLSSDQSSTPILTQNAEQSKEDDSGILSKDGSWLNLTELTTANKVEDDDWTMV